MNIDRALGTSRDYRDALTEKNVIKLKEMLQNPEYTLSAKQQFVIGMGYRITEGIEPSDHEPTLGDLILGPDEVQSSTTSNKKRREEARS